METRSEEAPSDAAVSLARAFHRDAMFTYILPDAEKRERVLPWFFGAAMKLGRRRGEVHESPGGAGAAIWLSPGNTDLGPADFLHSGLALAPAKFGPAAFRRFVKLTTKFEQARDSVVSDPFWHLFILGIDPTSQRAGAGGRLIAPVLARADEAGQACYLETTEAENLRFYERHGFAVAADEAYPGLPRFWAMVRPVRP